MRSSIPLVQSIRVAAPCDASWDEMVPIEGERVKYCSSCSLNVYNVSEMTAQEAEDLLIRHEGRLCVRYYQRQDGTILTKNCPVGVRAVGMSLIRRSAIAAGLFTLLFVAIKGIDDSQRTPTSVPHEEGITVTAGSVALPPVEELPKLPKSAELEYTMGKIARPKPTPVVSGETQYPLRQGRAVTREMLPTVEDRSTDDKAK